MEHLFIEGVFFWTESFLKLFKHGMPILILPFVYTTLLPHLFEPLYLYI